jgi:CO/xanthine dehydrogenase FAD-binding subunit
VKYLPRFEYVVPKSVEELSEFLHQYGHETRILAGGTDLLLNLDTADGVPKYLLDITRINELSAIRDEGHHIFVGSTTTHTDLAESKLIRGEALFLSEAAESVGSVQIRNTGTIGGNIVNASPAADTIPPLIALDAKAIVVGRVGEPQVPLSNLFSGPYKTALLHPEFLGGVRFAKLPSGAGTCFLKLGRRGALSISRISIAVALVLGTDERIQDIRICPGAVMPVHSRMVRSEQELMGRYPSSDLFEKAGERVAQEALDIAGKRPSTPYKGPVLKNLVQRALSIAAERCAMQ